MADGNDDLLDPNEIDSLLKQADGAPDEEQGAAASGENPDAADKDPSAQEGEPSGDSDTNSPESLLDSAEENLKTALAPEIQPPAGVANPEPYAFQSFDNDGGPSEPAFGLDVLQEVELDLRIELGRTELLIEEVLQLKEGAVVPLDKLAGDPVDILANGRLIARGEVLVLNDNFCVRVAEILSPEL